MSNSDHPINLQRRKFIHTVGTTLSVAAGGVALSQLLSHKANAADLPHLDENDSIAIAMGYKEDTTKVDPTKFPDHKNEQTCANCKYFQAEGDGAWGGCSTFRGKGVAAKGWCQVYEQ